MAEKPPKSFPTTFAEYAGVLFRPEELVTWRGAVTLSIAICIAVFATGNWMGFSNPGMISSTAAVFVLSISLWFVLREGYFRYGMGRRLGVVYKGYRVDRTDWAELKAELHTLFAASPAKRKISLKHLPFNFVQTEERWKHFQEKYKFEAILQITVSPSTDEKGEPVFEADLQPQFRRDLKKEVSTKATEIIGKLKEIPTQANSVQEILNGTGPNYFRMH